MRADSEARRRVEAAVRREAPSLLAYFERRAEPSDAADLLGDTLLVVWRRAHTMPVDELGARMWMFGVARKTLSSSRRSASRRAALHDRLQAEAWVRPWAVEPADPQLADAISRLPAVDVEIILLIHWDGFSLEEVARLLQRPAGTIRSRYSRARATLRRALTADETVH